ncbi:uncharacterized protein LOC131313025 isoform X1 [Rhododendron vialii]|uniref:uncharacterized protein LOC131313025 isoform X1 n=1 Tax=Rhododendron vialii TaxID=182163 RepID=UPI002660227A|nr:uncharacterized protein LOC131313025 isoform X1 [Rhododendron vialii]
MTKPFLFEEMANQGGNSIVLRDYRKGNWTVQETMVLIKAKKMDDERRMRRIGEITTATTSTTNIEGGKNIIINKPAELRWKWVEDYCWRNGCLRSQNQCNDKWDNLMRDFKKVRDYERKLREVGDQGGSSSTTSANDHSYWKIDKHERKERNLPSNMLPEIFQALVEVVERREGLRVVASGGAGGSSVVEIRSSSSNDVVVQQQQQPPSILLPPLLQYPISAPLAVLPIPPPLPLLPPPPPASAAQPPHGIPQSQQPLPTVDSDTSEHSDSAAKRRRKGGEGTSGGGGGGGSSNISNEALIGSAISKSASIIAEAIQACEEREEKRHRDLMSLQERRLQIEESKAEITRQGINGLVDAINKLANSILALANNSQNNQTPPSPN